MIEGCELLRVFFDGGIICPRKHLIMLYGPFSNYFSVSLIFLLQVNHSSRDTSCGRRSLRYAFYCYSVKAVLVHLIPVWTALFRASKADYWAKHDYQVNVIVPYHLPKVGERVTRTLRLNLAAAFVTLTLLQGARCSSLRVILLICGRLLRLLVLASVKLGIVVVEARGRCLEAG